MASALIVVSGVPLLGGAAVAYPGEDDVQKAKQAVTDKAAEIAVMQQQLDAAQARMDAADTALSVAAEDYDEARIALEAADTKADNARRAASLAADRLAKARVESGRLASSAYRSGGVGTLDVILSAGGPEEALDRASAVEILAQRQSAIVREVDESRARSDAASADAAKALTEQKAATEVVRKAQEAAQRQAASAQATYAAGTAEQTRLVAELAQARRTSVAVEQARQAGLAEEKRKREAAAALARARKAAQERAARAAAAAAAAGNARSSSSSSDDSGSGSDSSADPDPTPSGTASGTAAGGRKAVAWARTKVGLPYLWGGDGPDSYDCSGLVLQAWARSGVYFPHSSRLQYRLTEHIDYDQLRPGDLLFWATDPSRPSTIHHVALYAGGGMMVEAPRTGLDVRVVPVRYNSESMPFAGRP